MENSEKNGKWLTTKELREKFGIPEALTRRWSERLQRQGQARKSGIWLVSPDAVIFLMSRIEAVGRIPMEITPEMKAKIQQALQEKGSVNAVADDLEVSWRTADRLIARLRNEMMTELKV